MTISINDKTFAVIAASLNKRLVSQLEAAGAKVILFPPIQTEKRDLDEKSIALLRTAANFDWLIFPDCLAVDYFLSALEENRLDFFALDETHVCAFGEAVADRLRFVQLHADVIPNLIETEAIFSSLLAYIGEDEISGKTFLSLKGRSEKDKIKDKLSEKGAIVAELEIYTAEIAESKDNVRLKVLLKGGAIDEFIFSSPEDLNSLEKLFPNISLAKLLREIKVSAVDEVTFQSLKEHNLKPVLFKSVKN